MGSHTQPSCFSACSGLHLWMTMIMMWVKKYPNIECWAIFVYILIFFKLFFILLQFRRKLMVLFLLYSCSLCIQIYVISFLCTFSEHEENWHIHEWPVAWNLVYVVCCFMLESIYSINVWHISEASKKKIF